MVALCPAVASLSVERSMMPVVELLGGVGLTPPQVVAAITAHPNVLAFNATDTMAPAVAFLREDCGLDGAALAAAVASLPTLLGADVGAGLRPSLEFLRGRLGLEPGEIAAVVGGCPAVLTYEDIT
mmetsp:Transcript_31945/g.101750  ORF Transcript_31945/g.101750 Transcript_31945/m.101750 type:complete len:126 (+) Transcript_31945:221-598(+)